MLTSTGIIQSNSGGFKNLGGVPGEFLRNTLYNDSSLVSYWRLEDLTDIKSGNTLTNNGSATFVTGKFYNAVDLGASNSSKYLSIASNLGIAGNGDITICGWVNWDQTQTSLGTFAVLFAHSSTLTADRLFEVYTNNVPNTILYSGGQQSITSFGFTSGQWQHVAITMSGGNCTLYVDGAVITTIAQGTTTRGTNAFTIGADDTGASKAPCMFDDVIVFNKALSQSDIISIINQT